MYGLINTVEKCLRELSFCINAMKYVMYMRYFARGVLVVVATFWFLFALLSGAELYGGGWYGILMNSPNALPWLLLFGLVYVAWEWELIGGCMIAAMGVFTIFMFDAWEEPFVFLLISLPLMIVGGMLVACHFLRE